MKRRLRSSTVAAATLATLGLLVVPSSSASADTCTLSVAAVVNGVSYSYTDIHPDTVITLFGSFCSDPTGVLISQGDTLYLIYGGPWWYGSSSQINATLSAASIYQYAPYPEVSPPEPQPGTAYVNVKDLDNGLIADYWYPINILP
jgi:hypothetical protein